MHPIIISVVLERISELLDSKKSVSASLRQVAEEIRDLDKYCNENYKKIHYYNITTEHLKERRYK